jgi:hypothetical protein
MKKVFGVLVCLVLLSSPAVLYAKKDTSYNGHCNTSIALTFNVPKHSGGGVLYIPIYARITGMALADDNGKREISVASEIGTPDAAKATDAEIYELLSADYLQELYAEFVAEAINVELDN